LHEGGEHSERRERVDEHRPDRQHLRDPGEADRCHWASIPHCCAAPTGAGSGPPDPRTSAPRVLRRGTAATSDARRDLAYAPIVSPRSVEWPRGKRTVTTDGRLDPRAPRTS